MKIVFFGTPAFAVPFLECLVNDPDIEVVGVVCQPDKPVGRKQEVSAPAIKTCAVSHAIPVFQFPTLRHATAIETVRSLNADVAVLVVYGKILPQEILDVTPFGVVNVHPSLLPAYRGPSPMKSVLLNGESETGISIMLLDQGVDSGPILAQQSFLIDERETNTTLEQKVVSMGPEFLLNTLKQYVRGDLKPVPQDETKASMTNMLDRDDGRIDWKQTARQIDQQIRAFEPWPGTWTTWNDQRLKIIDADIVDTGAKQQPNGTIIQENDQTLIETAQGRIALKTVQLEGKQSQSVASFLAGHPTFTGSVLL